MLSPVKCFSVLSDSPSPSPWFHVSALDRTSATRDLFQTVSGRIYVRYDTAHLSLPCEMFRVLDRHQVGYIGYWLVLSLFRILVRPCNMCCRCVCKSGYIGNGRVCYGNLLEVNYQCKREFSRHRDRIATKIIIWYSASYQRSSH